MNIKNEVNQVVIEIVKKYKKEPSPLMLILSEIQKKYGYISIELQQLVSDLTGIPISEIYGVVTFYNFFSLNPKGKYVISVCLGTACYVKGGENILDRFSKVLNIKPGETTSDGLFTIDAIRCLGACGIAPAVSINGKVYPKVTLPLVDKIIAEYKAKGGNE